MNITAMDYYDPSVTNIGTAAIDAAAATHSQLMAMYPSLSSQQAWHMLGVTPLIGINDDPSEIFTLAKAQQLTTFSQQHGIGELSMGELPRDLTGTLGAADATPAVEVRRCLSSSSGSSSRSPAHLRGDVRPARRKGQLYCSAQPFGVNVRYSSLSPRRM